MIVTNFYFLLLILYFAADSNIAAPPLIKWCRTNTPTAGFVLNTNDSDIYIRFSTDKSIAFPGISVVIYPVFASKLFKHILTIVSITQKCGRSLSD